MTGACLADPAVVWPLGPYDGQEVAFFACGGLFTISGLNPGPLIGADGPLMEQPSSLYLISP